METANLITLWQLESELLGVVVDVLNAIQLQADETLIKLNKR